MPLFRASFTAPCPTEKLSRIFQLAELNRASKAANFVNNKIKLADATFQAFLTLPIGTHLQL